jgi:hypothetical protein
MFMKQFLNYWGIATMGLLAIFVRSSQADGSANPSQAELAMQILADQNLREVHRMAQDLLKGGLNAGSGYGEVWIRDLNTFITIALEVNPPRRFREAILTFFKFQGANGDIVDGYIPLDQAKVKYAYRTSSLAPDLMAHKNTVETDQESSLVQAVRKYIMATRDETILQERIAGMTVRERLGHALEYVLTERFDQEHGLVWGATTADWGDVQPETPWGVALDASSHRALSIYDNAMLVIAINDYVQLLGENALAAARWKTTRDELKKNVRKHLWDAKRQKFIPHVYLAGSPFPKDFDENAIYYHGGTAVAIEAGLLTPAEVARSLLRMEADVRLAGAASIGLTLYPPYPEGYFNNPEMRVPYSYQNGGDWCWFGGRMIQELVKQGYIAEAYRELQPMVERVKRTGGFYEWWSRDNQPRGSGEFRGSAGVLGQAIEMLQSWAEQSTRGSARAEPVSAQDAAAARASFYDMHLGFFAHYMFPGKEYQWGATVWADGSAVKSLDELADNFDAEDFAATAQLMRAQYIIFTTSHANMNVLFPSQVMNRYLPGHSSKRDVLRALIQAVQARNIRVLFYIHPSDGHDFTKEDQDRIGWNDDPPHKRYNDFINEYYAELVDRYGKDVSGYFMDGGVPTKLLDLPRLRTTILSRQPAAWLVQNGGLNRSCNDYGAYETLDPPYPAAIWAVNKPITGQWWALTNSVVICPELAYRYTVLQASVKDRQGGGVGWSFGPHPGGRWELGVHSFCERLGVLIDKAGPSLFGTRPSKAYLTLNRQALIGLAYVATESADGKKTYLHQFLPPRTQQLELPAPADGHKFSSAHLLDNNHKVDLQQTDNSIRLSLKQDDRWDDVDTIIVLE